MLILVAAVADQRFALHRAPNRFAGRIVPALTTSTHGANKVVLPQVCLVEAGAVLRPLVRVDDRAGHIEPLLEPSLYGHIKRLQHERRVHLRADRVAENPAATEIHEGAEVPITAVRERQIRDVAHPGAVELTHSEVAVQEIREDRQAVVAVGRSDEALPVAVPDDAVISKHASEALHAHVDTVAAQVDAHLPAPGV